MERRRTLEIALGALALCLMGFALVSYRANHKPPSAPAFPPAISLDPEKLQAEAAILYDPASHRILYAKNGELQLPLASLTKLMTAEVALAHASSTAAIRISHKAIMTEGDSGLREGETWQAGNLIAYSLRVSSNDGMAAVAESLGGKKFIAAMNDEARALGLAQSYFLDPTGLDLTTGTSGGYGSARDVAILASDFYRGHPELFEGTVDSRSQFVVAKNPSKPTATPIFDIPGLVGAKTGYTDLAGGNLVVVFDIALGHPVVGVVLHSTENGRFEDMRALIVAARSALQS